MKYIDVSWTHTNQEEPVRLVSELDEAGYETRKLEFFQDGHVGFAYDKVETIDTRLGTLPVPPLAEINSDPEFTGVEITKEVFDPLWQKYTK